MDSQKENKTKDSQLKAIKAYEERKGLTTIACKITKDYKKQIEKHITNKGYKSINAYLLALIKKDMNEQVIVNGYELQINFIKKDEYIRVGRIKQIMSKYSCMENVPE